MDKLSVIEQKLIKKPQLLHYKTAWELKDQKVVFTNGCFDLLHRGHIEYLARAASLGDILVVGINTDTSVRKIKDNNRPLQDEYSRALAIAALHFVGYVMLFEEDTPHELIKAVEPDILVKGDDYNVKDIVGYDLVNKSGGQVQTIKLTKGYSTSAIINKCMNLKAE